MSAVWTVLWVVLIMVVGCYYETVGDFIRKRRQRKERQKLFEETELNAGWRYLDPDYLSLKEFNEIQSRSLG